MNFTHLALAAFVAAGASSVVAFRQGESAERGRRAQLDLAVASATSAAASSAQSKIDELELEEALASSSRQSAVHTIREKTYEIIDRPIYRNVCVDADGVRILDQAVDIANGKSVAISSGDTEGLSAGPTQR